MRYNLFAPFLWKNDPATSRHDHWVVRDVEAREWKHFGELCADYTFCGVVDGDHPNVLGRRVLLIVAPLLRLDDLDKEFLHFWRPRGNHWVAYLDMSGAVVCCVTGCVQGHMACTVGAQA